VLGKQELCGRAQGDQPSGVHGVRLGGSFHGTQRRKALEQSTGREAALGTGSHRRRCAHQCRWLVEAVATAMEQAAQRNVADQQRRVTQLGGG